LKRRRFGILVSNQSQVLDTQQDLVKWLDAALSALLTKSQARSLLGRNCAGLKENPALFVAGPSVNLEPGVTLVAVAARWLTGSAWR
jgi:hypothetical protein